MSTPKKTSGKTETDPHAIVFGFDRSTDEKSLQLFLQRFTDEKVFGVLLTRLQDKEISAMVDFLTAIMRKHLSEEEYHALFLAE